MEGKIRRIATVLVALMMGVGIGMTWNYAKNDQASAGQELSAGTEKYQEIMDLVDQYFIGGDDLDMTQVNDAMASGIISGLCGGLPELCQQYQQRLCGRWHYHHREE